MITDKIINKKRPALATKIYEAANRQQKVIHWLIEAAEHLVVEDESVLGFQCGLRTTKYGGMGWIRLSKAAAEFTRARICCAYTFCQFFKP